MTKFGILFSLKVRHSYFKDGICPYLAIEPDLPTKSIFVNKHIITKEFTGELKIIAPVSEKKGSNATAVNAITSDNKHYTFLLKITDTAFFNITDLDFTGFPKQVYYFYNTAKSSKLSVKNCATVDGILTTKYDEDKIPSKIKLINQDNVEIYNGEINKPNAFVFDLSAYKSGLYTLTTTFPKQSQVKAQTQTFYYNSLIRREPVLGVIDIDVSGISVGEEITNDFIIQFDRHK